MAVISIKREREILNSFLIESMSPSKIIKRFGIDGKSFDSVLTKYGISRNYQGLLKEFYSSKSPINEVKLDKIMSESLTEIKALKYFLVYGFSKRAICRLIKELKDVSGNKAQRITEKYSLDKTHRGILFLHTRTQFEKIIAKIIMDGKADPATLVLNLDRFTSKYQGLKLIRDNCSKKFYNALDGELRNIIQSIYRDLKTDVKTCQYTGCNNNKLQSSHANDMGKTRPELFEKSVEEYILKTGDENSIDIQEVINNFLKKHQNCVSNAVGKKRYPPVTFLCSKHHNEYEALFDKRKNKKLGSIVYDIKDRAKYDAFINELNI